MASKPLVSAIITTFNRRAFLREALNSVVSQDYRHIEVIVIDDGSKDGSFREARESSIPVRYVWKQNGGISSARNLGISLANGRYIAFLDCDDLWKKNKLTAQVEALAGSDVPLIYTNETWIRNGRHLNQKKRHAKFSGWIYPHCLPLCIISPSSALIERRIFDEVGLFDENMPVCEDYDLWLRITCRYPVLFLEDSLIVKRGGHDDQLSKSQEAMDRFRIYSLLKMLQEDLLPPELRRLTVEELARKSIVYAKGAEKRGRADEASHYLSLVDTYLNG
ncbi:MAG TPA: glycosyl transferase [Deltaproteobacteria bacterium]|nr:glycosyl transferase [Deltaproteobacteria bacterium]